jgi:hypothetical protein
LFRSTPLEDFDVTVDKGHSGRSDAGNAGGLAESERADAREFFYHLSGEAGDLPVIEPVRNVARFGALHPLHLFVLLSEITFVLEIGLDATGFFAGECAIGADPLTRPPLADTLSPKG